jgi:rubrerythrin
MQKPTDTGKNRTGIDMSPIHSRLTIEGAAEANTGGMLDGMALSAERSAWARAAPPLGTVPPPGTVKGMLKTVLEKLQGHQPTVLIDKLGERLAFERTGTRLYEAVMSKLAGADAHPGGPAREELEEIRDAEQRHAALVADAIRQLGADPTAMTPGGDLVAVAGSGWVQVVTDPRTTLTQCLDILLVAELADHGGWELLIGLSDRLGFDELASNFRTALAEETGHVTRVQRWIATAVLGEATAVWPAA